MGGGGPARGSGRRAVLIGVIALVIPAGEARGQWVEPPGEGWADLTVYHHDTRETYGSDGEPRDFFAGGHAVATSAFLTVAGGLVRGVDAWVQVPLQRLEFTDVGGERIRSGIGDTRVYLRAQPALWLGGDLPVSVRGGVKLPVGDFQVDSEVIPLGDGQRDWELIVEGGHSFHPLPLYVTGWVGYRWRERNDETRRDFGDEAFFLASAGGQMGRFGYKAVLEGWEGDPPEIEGVVVPSAKREMLQLTPTLSWRVGPGALSAGARIPLGGKNLPSGSALVVGYFTDWSY